MLIYSIVFWTLNHLLIFEEVPSRLVGQYQLHRSSSLQAEIDRCFQGDESP